MKPKHPLYQPLKIPLVEGKSLDVPIVDQETINKYAKEEGVVILCMPADDDVMRDIQTLLPQNEHFSLQRRNQSLQRQRLVVLYATKAT